MPTSHEPPLTGTIIKWDHQFAAYDSLQHWQLSRAAWDYFNSHAPQQFVPARNLLK
jgi:hypothetical protein